MQNIFAIIAAAGALTMPQTGIATNAPVAVSTCTVSDLYNSAINAEFGPPISYRMLQLTFLNTDDAVATQVTFDVTHDGAHTVVIDRGRFSKGVPIERLYDAVTGAYGGGSAECAVAAITFADGRRWTAPGGTTTAATLR
jgi:hypothetical protein